MDRPGSSWIIDDERRIVDRKLRVAGFRMERSTFSP
jgi:hypothetical protein